MIYYEHQERDADFLYDTKGKYIQDAEKDGRQDLPDKWKTIKQDRVKYIRLLKNALEKEIHQQTVCNFYFTFLHYKGRENQKYSNLRNRPVHLALY